MPTPEFKSLAPVLFVEEVEPCLSFWTEKLGFQLQQQVAEGDAMGFAMLVGGEVTVMYQTRASLKKDLPQLAEQSFRSSTLLYISVGNLDEVESRLKGVEVVVPRRTTFYGATEIAVREPGGNLVCFAEHGQTPASQ